MDGLRNSRVVVIDDEIQEATPILRALSQKGISASYFTGDVDELPPVGKALSGIRLILLDARLQGEGARGNISANLLAVLERIVSTQNGPYGIVLWTKHPEDREDFQQRLFESDTLKLPLFVELLAKDDFGLAADQFDLAELQAQLRNRLNPMSSFRVLFKWEEDACCSISEVIASLDSDLIEKDTDIPTTTEKTLNRLDKTLKRLAVAEMGQGLTEKNFCEGIFRSLTPIFFDRITTKTPSGLDDCSRSLFGSAAAKDKIIDAKLNSRIHLDFAVDTRFAPGSVYIYSESKRGFQKGFPGYEGYRSLLKEEQNALPKQPNKIAAAAAKRQGLFDALKAGSKLIAVEISPDCDHSQNKIAFARFVCGLLITNEQRKNLIDNTPAIWSKDNLWFDDNWPENEDPKFGSIVLNFRFVVSLPRESVKRLARIMRLRDQLCGELRAELAAFMARPGVVYLP